MKRPVDARNLNDEAILDTVRRSLSRFGAAYPLAGSPARYVWLDKTFVNERVLAREPALARQFKARHVRTIPVQMPLSARVIHVSPRAARILSFERAPSKTAKVVLSGVTYKGTRRSDKYSFRNEIRARRTVSHLDTPFTVPQMTGYSLREHWFVEDMVEGRRLSRAEFSGFLLHAMVPFYQTTMKLRSLGRLRNAKKLIGDLKEMVPELPLPSLNDQLPIILGHGDLNGSNFFWHRDGYCLIDWEYAGVMPAAFDLAKLYQLSASLKGAIAEAIARLDSNPGTIPPLTQLALGALDLTKEARNAGDDWTIRRMERYGLTRDQAERQKKELQHQTQVFIRKLFAS